MFVPLELTWRDQVYTVPPDRILGAIAVVEEHVTMGELATEAQAGRLRLARLTKAFAALLRYAGAKVQDDEVYVSLFDGKPAEAKQRIVDSVNVLMALMVPVTPMEGVPRGNASPGAARLSKRSIKRSSVRGG